jgi:Domain of unknown function (4846)
MSHTLLFFFCFLLINCKEKKHASRYNPNSPVVSQLKFERVKAIPPPDGYERVKLAKGSFGEWLRTISLKKDDHVYLYDGSLKRNQAAQFAVLDIRVGNRDLQQCADAVMRLRAEYLFAEGRYSEIVFRDNNDTPYEWKGKGNKQGFDKYLETVFGMCGTASLEKQLEPVGKRHQMQPGDVFIKGGFPGHAMIVVDVAANKNGKKIFMLAQSYMPAQDIHIVKNPGNEKLNPWYETSEERVIITPEWQFKQNQLYKW